MSPGTSAPTVARFHAVVPAAGVGRRLGSVTPKQYLDLGGLSVLRRTVEALSLAGWLESINVVVAPQDETAATLLSGMSRVRILNVGGVTRRDSVRNGLLALDGTQADDWILVHDAARPGVSLDALERLRRTVDGDAVGGLLALPVADTVKRAGAGRVEAGAFERAEQTVARDGLWLAQTPQIFRRQLLLTALDHCPMATDEASAVEALGHRPLLVPGGRENFKITTSEDLDWMRRLLAL